MELPLGLYNLQPKLDIGQTSKYSHQWNRYLRIGAVWNDIKIKHRSIQEVPIPHKNQELFY